MLGMSNVNNRTRVHAGIKTGGQFAAEAHQEPEGVLLARASPLDQAAIATVGDMVQLKFVGAKHLLEPGQKATTRSSWPRT